MAAKDSSITLPWLWVIEALASCEQVDISLLNDLIKRAPEFPDNVGKNTREMIALRCLEGVFRPSNEIINDIPSAPDSKIGFNSSESCEDVLQRILREMSISNLRMAGPDLLKWDVRPFIMHKRACLPKCALEQLKDGILEGTHPSAAFFSKRSGLAIRNECDNRNPVDDGDPNATLSRFDGSCIDHQIKAASRKSIALIPENGNGPLQEDSPNRILLPSKRGRSDLADENLAGQSHELSMENGGDLHLNAKKFKQGSSSTSQSVGQDLVPLHRNEQLEDSSGRTIPDTEREGVDLAKESQVGGLEGSVVSEDVHGDNVSSKSFEQSSDVNDDKVQHNQLQSRNNNKLPQDTSGDGPYQNISVDGDKGDIECCVQPKASNAATPNGIQQKISIDAAKDDAEASFHRKTPNGVSPDGSKGKRIASEAEDDMEHDGEEETSSESDGYHKEKIDVTTKKHCFLSSQSIFSQDSLSTADWTEQNLCMKCNKDGHLLVCSASGCPLVVHESCLGSSASF
ncbi:hypothetical protein L1049_008374 [Liquidambar formosana]|uniref:Zinc finger PHD-type domain-containing protein n=1 Tax=Liquidambar formosana TaxID=63359 RepID=A0AAP0S3F8_LIQFO